MDRIGMRVKLDLEGESGTALWQHSACWAF